MPESHVSLAAADDDARDANVPGRRASSGATLPPARFGFAPCAIAVSARIVFGDGFFG